jgi:hypothetical protein
MPLSEYDFKEALRAATDWLLAIASELPGSVAAREGIADTIPLRLRWPFMACSPKNWSFAPNPPKRQEKSVTRDKGTKI